MLVRDEGEEPGQLVGEHLGAWWAGWWLPPDRRFHETMSAWSRSASARTDGKTSPSKVVTPTGTVVGPAGVVARAGSRYPVSAELPAVLVNQVMATLVSR